MTESAESSAAGRDGGGNAAPSVDLSGPNVTRIVLRLAIPAVIGLSINGFHHLVNTAYLSMVSTEAVSAISSSIPIVMILAAIGEGIGVGAAAYIARNIGAKRLELAHVAATTAMVAAIVLGIAVAALLLADLPALLTALGATPAALPQAQSYAGILIFGACLMFLQMLCDFIAISEGNTRFAMWALLGSFGLNILLDPLFIFALDMGTQGAALATVCAEAAAVGAYAVYFARRKGMVRLHPRFFQPSLALLRALAGVGLPASLATALSAVASTLIYRHAGGYGDAAVAGIGIAMRLLGGGSMPVIGFCLGAQALLGFNWGAGDFARLLRVLKTMLLITSAFSLTYSLTMIAFAPQIVGFFTDDPQVLAIGVTSCRAVHIFFAFFGLHMVTVVMLQSAGKAKLAAFLVLAPHGYFLIPLLLLLTPFWGLEGVIGAQALSAGFASLLALAIILRQAGHLRRQAADVP